MSLKQHFELLADYNQWMNEKVYAAAGQLSAPDLIADRGAFFASVLGTLNHILVADIIWLQRFATHPSCHNSLGKVADLQRPSSLDQILFAEFDELSEQRDWLDSQIVKWTAGLFEGDLDVILSYHDTKGIAASRQYSSLMLHFFNHQTHHRGQVSTLLSQAGVDVGVTDLLALIPRQA